MTTQPTSLPFNLEPEFDYILTAKDREEFAPLQKTDEVFKDEYSRWDVTEASPEDGFCTNRFYRRRKSSGWVSVKERLPEANSPILATAGEKLYTFPRGYGESFNMDALGFTHWQPWTLPALPQPPKPAAEVAFEEWWNEGKNFVQIGPVWKSYLARNAFLAAVAWAKDHKEAL